jgi:hypothetical protein
MAVVRVSEESRFPKLNACRAMIGLPPLPDTYPNSVIDHAPVPAPSGEED